MMTLRGHGDGLRGAVVDGVIVNRALNRLPLLELTQVLDHQVRLKGVGVVVVELAALLKGEVVMGAVIVVVAQDGDVVAEALHQIFHQGGLAAAGAARDADDQNVIHSHTSDSARYQFTPMGLAPSV